MPLLKSKGLAMLTNNLFSKFFSVANFNASKEFNPFVVFKTMSANEAVSAKVPSLIFVLDSYHVANAFLAPSFPGADNFSETFLVPTITS
jgi:hypothetical protein